MKQSPLEQIATIADDTMKQKLVKSSLFAQACLSQYLGFLFGLKARSTLLKSCSAGQFT